MQLSTNRVNFTTSSVAQFNYARFLTKSSSTQKGISDIVNVLGVHCDGFAAFEKTRSVISWRLANKVRILRKSRALVLFVPPKKVKFKIDKPESWCRIELTHMKLYCGFISTECNFWTGEIMCFFKNKTLKYYTIVDFTNESRGKDELKVISK